MSQRNEREETSKHSVNFNGISERRTKKELRADNDDEAVNDITGIPGHYDAKKNPAPRSMSLKNLMASTFKERPHIVEKLLPMGCIVLVGAPKVGKSWFVYQLARSVAAGVPFLGRKVKKGQVIYYALEDGMSRLQSRAKAQKLKGCEEYPDDVILQTELPKAKRGGLKELEEMLDEFPGISLVVIDVLKMFRDARNGKSNAYDDDYADVRPLTELALKHDVCIVLVHHTNKGNEKASDPFERVSGTGGISGAADGTILIVHDAERRIGMYGRGRDFPEFDIPLAFDKDNCIWQIDEESRDATPTNGYSNLTGKVIKVLEMENGNAITPSRISALLEVPSTEVSKRLATLEKGGNAVRVGRGEWVLGGKEPRYS